mmetsp:Transcript_28726/g.66271  ORF Transcript_28726/g.66271 Transcript_28726/m.66271 type:complete len:155 (-) Transcript_28726:205-669(-)
MSSLDNPNPTVFARVDRVRTNQRLPGIQAEDVFDVIRTIKDPEHPYSLEELNVVSEHGVDVRFDEHTGYSNISLNFTPTVPHCSLAILIGLCIRVKCQRELVGKFKLDIAVPQGTHQTASEVTRQVNDKERVAAAQENPALMSMVEECVAEIID